MAFVGNGMESWRVARKWSQARQAVDGAAGSGTASHAAGDTAGNDAVASSLSDTVRRSPRPTAAAGSGKLTTVQALRAVAALLVVLFHLGTIEGRFAGGYSLLAPLGDLGALGVYIFFVISGFIMITTNWEEFGRTGASKQFLLRRVLRIVPPYWIVTALLLVVYLRDPHLMNQSSPYPTSIVSSFLLLPQRGYALLVVGWTLVFEMYFYYVFTLLLACARRYAGSLLGVWLIGMVALRELVYPHHPDNPYLELVSSPNNLLFIAGIVAGWLTLTRGTRAPRVFALVGAVLTALLYFLPWRTGALFPLSDWAAIAVVAIPISMMLYGVVRAELSGGLRCAAWVVVVGDASYALYLWHIPILAIFARASHWLPLHILPLHILWLAAAIAATTLIAVGIYRRVERPVLKMLMRRPPTVVSA